MTETSDFNFEMKNTVTWRCVSADTTFSYDDNEEGYYWS